MPEDSELRIDADVDTQDWPALRETTLADLEVQFGELDIHSAGQDVLRWMDRMTAFAHAVKQARDAVYSIAISWIEANGDLQLSDQVRFTIGYQRTTKCVDVRRMLHVALDALGGDVEAVACLLAADAWKHGAAKGALPREAFESLFSTEMKARLISGQPAPKRLVRIDERYGHNA